MIETYQQAQAKYKPDDIQILFIAESPPAIKNDEPPRYFYFEVVKVKDFLFIETMKALYPSEFKNYDRDPEIKRYFLEKYKSDEYFLIDAVDEPINKSSEKTADNLILENKHRLIDTIQGLCNKSTKIILIKANVHRLLYSELKESKFIVLNDEPLPFPSNGWQEKYREELNALILKVKNGRR